MSENYYPPTLNADSFHCPHCNVYAHQYWYLGAKATQQWRDATFLENLLVSLCQRCGKYALWLNGKMIYPASSIVPLPSEDMPKNVKEDYLEGRSIVNSSPRATAALLRLALQKLMVSLGESGKDLDKDIGNMVKKGLPVTIQQALDCVRVIGNNAVHPGELDLKDDRETAVALFDLLNIIVNVMITQPKEVKALYEKIPKGAKEAIRKRDDTTKA